MPVEKVMDRPDVSSTTAAMAVGVDFSAPAEFSRGSASVEVKLLGNSTYIRAYRSALFA
jgi:hypothetical protein